MPHPNQRLTIPERILEKVFADPDTGCLTFTGYRQPNGYAVLAVARGKPRVAHRLMYEAFIGPIPDGLILDHLCRNRACVNPAHLEVVTRGENVLRGVGLAAVNVQKTQCKRGHSFTPENTRYYRGKRCCRRCAARAAAVQRRKRGRSPPSSGRAREGA